MGGFGRTLVLKAWAGLFLLLTQADGLAADAPSPPAGTPVAADASSGAAPANRATSDDLLNLDINQLAHVPVKVPATASNLSVPSSQITSGNVDLSTAATTGELARQAPDVSTRRTSGINLDPRVRGYHSGQLNASANGMSEVKTRLDIDSALSQIDPGVVEDVTVIDGPYTSLYGPGFAFLIVDLLKPPRYAAGPEFHSQTDFVYGANGQTLYPRETVVGGDKDWGFCLSYGLRTGNDYLTGGHHPERVPSSYQKWDDLLTVSADVSRYSRIEFDYIHCEMNDVELPGVVYDLDNSTNNQFNLRYIVQEDPKGPRQLVLQSWYQTTNYHGDALRASKQNSFYWPFMTLPISTDGELAVNTVGQGLSDSLGARLLRTFGEADSVQFTLGADWSLTQQRYQEVTLDPAGDILYGGDVFGIAKSRMNDFGVLADLFLPASENVSVHMGGRLDYSYAWFDAHDPVITAITDPEQYYYMPGFAEPHNVLGMAYLTGKIKLNDEDTLNVGTAYAMRMPDLAELYSDDPYVPLARFGNSYVSGYSDLSPEKNLQFDVGLTTVKKRCTYGVRGFWALIWDYIQAAPAYIDPSPPEDAATHVLHRDFRDFPEIYRTDFGNSRNADTCQAGYQYVNLNFATLIGGDLFAEVRLADWLSVYGSMAYVHGTNWDPVAFVADEYYTVGKGTVVPLGGSEGLLGIYPFNGTIAIRIFEPESQRWLLEFGPRMVAAQNYVATSLAELPTPGFTTFDIRGYYRMNEHLRLNMALENLFNREYYEHGSLVIVNSHGVPTFIKEPGFNALIGMEARF